MTKKKTKASCYDFEWAMRALEQGYTIRRKAWHPYYFVVDHTNDHLTWLHRSPGVDPMKWTTTPEDREATDWVRGPKFVEKKEKTVTKSQRGAPEGASREDCQEGKEAMKKRKSAAQEIAELKQALEVSERESHQQQWAHGIETKRVEELERENARLQRHLDATKKALLDALCTAHMEPPCDVCGP